MCARILLLNFYRVNIFVLFSYSFVTISWFWPLVCLRKEEYMCLVTNNVLFKKRNSRAPNIVLFFSLFHYVYLFPDSFCSCGRRSQFSGGKVCLHFHCFVSIVEMFIVVVVIVTPDTVAVDIDVPTYVESKMEERREEMRKKDGKLIVVPTRRDARLHF